MAGQCIASSAVISGESEPFWKSCAVNGHNMMQIGVSINTLYYENTQMFLTLWLRSFLYTFQGARR